MTVIVQASRLSCGKAEKRRKSRPVQERENPKQMRFDDVILGRRSIRGYKPDPVPRALIEEIIGLAMRVPSSMNTQPWNFHVITGEPLDRIRAGNTERMVAGVPQSREFRTGQAFAGQHRDRQVGVAKQLFSANAMKKKWISGDPSTGIKRTKVGEVRSWTDDEIRQYENHWPIGTKQRTAFALMLYTGQRRSDVHRMIWRDISDKTGRIKVIQQKTGVKIQVPLHRDLLVVLEKARHNHVSILVTEWGKPFTVDGFSGFMRDAIRAAGLPLDCQPHGLRKAAGRRLAEAGCTTKQIMAVLGHKSLAEAERYTKEADQIRLATDAMSRLEEQTANEVCPNRPFRFGQTPKRSGDTK